MNNEKKMSFPGFFFWKSRKDKAGRKTSGTNNSIIKKQNLSNDNPNTDCGFILNSQNSH